VNLVQADVAFEDTDTTVNVVHNMELSATGADGRPLLSCVLMGAGAVLNQAVLEIVDANTISVTPVLTGVGSRFNVRVDISRGPAAASSL
jgi:hypothetical protein